MIFSQILYTYALLIEIFLIAYIVFMLLLTMFQYLLQCEQILYTTVPVSGMEDLEKAFLDNCEGV